MDCVEVADLLLAPEPGRDPQLAAHVQDCPACAHMASGLARVDAILSSSVVVVPPAHLQVALSQLALEAARPARLAWWQPVRELDVGGWLTRRPQMIAAQGLAAVMLALASWQIFGWLSTFQPVVGDVAYAMELVAASPAVAYLGNISIDFQSLTLWSLVGIAGWLISENGLIGRRIAASGLQLP
ncbi:MAG: hypothetical protein JO352_14850 [Chloroflexi bacterium]|nr:hypothetical protein [Chloroflexota bacterium]MBV9600789.1 hypothetical protein [Chloroflexota bacterium]